MIEVMNIDKNKILAERVILAKSFLSRLKGLMFKNDLSKGQGLMIEPCKMIHTFGMRFSIDVIFISKDDVVVYGIEKLPPRRISPFVYKAYSVLELPVGSIKKTNTKVGDRLAMILTSDGKLEN